MFKPVFDTSDQCGAPNPLLTLSKNFDKSNSRVTSNAEQAIQRLTGSHGTAGELLAQEYLANVAQRMAPPATFDMRQMLAQLPASRQAQNDNVKAQMEQSWADANRQAVASNWANQFLNGVAQQEHSQLAQGWAQELVSSQQSNGMETAWQVAKTKPMWATEFLEHYDKTAAHSQGQMPTTTTMDSETNQLARDWEQEFMEALAKTQMGSNEENAFFDYGSAWEAAHSKEAQERYQFVKENPFLGEQDPLGRAQQSLAQGRLADSILHFEAALQAEPNNPEIWHSLGLALAENEQDPRAISAYRNALKLNPRHENAMLALAASLANESFEHLALHELHKWICAHQGRELPEDGTENTAMFRQYSPLDRVDFGKVERQFLESARANQQLVDAELQNALSVLYNLGNDYERALDCLRAALSLRPEDPLLWNRLGATLANADRSAEAINAYKRALQLSPSYVRARYNLGTACMNLNSYRDAAAYFLAALQIQHSPDQSQIWSRLRSAIIRIDWPDPLGPEVFDALDRRDLPHISQLLRDQRIAG